MSAPIQTPLFSDPATEQSLERTAAALTEHGFLVEILDDVAAARARVQELIRGAPPCSPAPATRFDCPASMTTSTPAAGTTRSRCGDGAWTGPPSARRSGPRCRSPTSSWAASRRSPRPAPRWPAPPPAADCPATPAPPPARSGSSAPRRSAGPVRQPAPGRGARRPAEPHAARGAGRAAGSAAVRTRLARGGAGHRHCVPGYRIRLLRALSVDIVRHTTVWTHSSSCSCYFLTSIRPNLRPST